MSLDVSVDGKLTKNVDCPHCQKGFEVETSDFYFSQNITHNLGKMADAAGIYGCVWRPEEHGIETANQLIMPLTEGITLLKSDPERFKAFDSPNGWGTYENFVPWLEKYLEACQTCPKGTISVSR